MPDTSNGCKAVKKWVHQVTVWCLFGRQFSISSKLNTVFHILACSMFLQQSITGQRRGTKQKGIKFISQCSGVLEAQDGAPASTGRVHAAASHSRKRSPVLEALVGCIVFPNPTEPHSTESSVTTGYLLNMVQNAGRSQKDLGETIPHHRGRMELAHVTSETMSFPKTNTRERPYSHCVLLQLAISQQSVGWHPLGWHTGNEQLGGWMVMVRVRCLTVGTGLYKEMKKITGMPLISTAVDLCLL